MCAAQALLQRQDALTKREVEVGQAEQEVAAARAEMEHEIQKLKESQDADRDRARLAALLRVSTVSSRAGILSIVSI